MVFHKFLSGEVGGERLVITVNGQKLVPWDPFARAEARPRNSLSRSSRSSTVTLSVR